MKIDVDMAVKLSKYLNRRSSGVLCIMYIHAPAAYKAGFTADASATRMCGGAIAPGNQTVVSEAAPEV